MDTELEQRIKRAANEQTAGMTLDHPALAPAPGTTPRSRRRTWFGAAAGIAAVACAVVIGFDVGDRGTRIDAGPADGSDVDRYYLPATWPPGMDGPIETAELSDLVRGPDAGPSTLLAFDGRASAVAHIMEIDLDGLLGGPGELMSRITLDDGRQGMFVDVDTERTLFVDLGDGRAVVLRAVTGQQTPLEQFATAFAPASGALDASALPTGWSVVDDPSGAAALAFGGPVPASPWRMASRYGQAPDGTFRSMTLLTSATQDADAAVELVRDLAGAGGREVEVGPDRSGVLVEALEAPIITLVWSPADGVIAALGGEGVTADELVDTARSVRAVDRAEWEALRIPGRDPGGEGPSPMCEALGARVEGLTDVGWQNGITRTAATWAVVLSEELFRLDRESRAAVAAAVRSDDGGFGRVRATVDTDDQPALERMRNLALDPASTRPRDATSVVHRDLAALRRLRSDCGLA